MRRLPLLLLALAAGLAAAEDTAENRRLVRELDHVGLVESILPKASLFGLPNGANLPWVPEEDIRKMRETGRIQDLANLLDEAVLRGLTDAELVAWNRHQTRPEAREVRWKNRLVVDDIQPVIRAVALAATWGARRHECLEIEERWPVIPFSRRALLEEALPLLPGSLDALDPAKLRDQILDQALADAKARNADAREVTNIQNQTGQRGTGRILNACAEAYARRLTTAEARWLLDCLRDPAYRSASLKMEPAMMQLLDVNLRCGR